MQPISVRRPVLAIILAVLLGAVALSVADIRLASSQTTTLVATRTEREVPLDDPFAAVWNSASPIESPLSAQRVIPPRGGGDRTVTARALNHEDRLFVLLEWEDETEDSFLSEQTLFSDAAAVQFPAEGGETVPSFCMGDPTAPVNIWQWKAAWQTDVEQGYVDVEDVYPNMQVDFYPFEEEEVFYPARAVGNIFAQAPRESAADNLLAGSFGTLTQAEDQIVQGAGEWRDGSWRVIFARDLETDGDYTQFAQDESSNIAFAVWDGSQGERDGIKSVSQFLTLEVSSETVGGRNDPTLWLIVLIVLAAVAVPLALAHYLRRRQGG